MSKNLKNFIIKISNSKKLIELFKHILWLFIPKIVSLYYNFKWASSRKIVIVPHFGLGDLAVLVPALKEFEKKFELIYIAGKKDYIEAILVLFNFSEKIRILNFEYDNKKYNIGFSNKEKLLLNKYGKVIFLGTCDNDPIINYPDSFYIKMGLSTKIVTHKYNFDYNNINHFLNNTLTNYLKFIDKCIYININSSKGDIKLPQHFEIASISKKIFSFGKSAEAFGISCYTDTHLTKVNSNVESIIYNVFLSLYSKLSILSDAGLFNIVIRFKECKELKVVTRAHNHTHNNLLYKIQFNGKIQSRSPN